VVASSSDDIVYSNLFTGVHGNYLKGSIVAQGRDPTNRILTLTLTLALTPTLTLTLTRTLTRLDPANLPESDPSKMNFEEMSGG
jgi:hypothetical protein